jgi:CelD/BcsL family acetyltransferase involved in cellulose biosynthesis
VADSVDATVFQTFEWFDCWWRALGQENQLYLVTLWDDTVLAGIAPMMLVRRAGLRRLEFIGSPNADYHDFILGNRASELLPLLIRFLHERRVDWDMMVLRNVPTDSQTFSTLPAITRSLGLSAIDLERIACPTFEIASRPAEVRRWLERYSLRRRLKQLRSQGELGFRRCQTQDELDRYLPLFFEQYIERRQGTQSAAVFRRPEVQGFFVSLAKAMQPAGWLHFSVLECAGKPIAFHLGFEFGSRLYWYKPSFDLSMARYSPGKILLSCLIRDALDHDLREVDFTVGNEAFKARYTRKSRTNANIRVFHWRWLYLATLVAIWVLGRVSSRKAVGTTSNTRLLGATGTPPRPGN